MNIEKMIRERLIEICTGFDKDGAIDKMDEILDLEKNILGAILLEKDNYHIVKDILHKEMFTSAIHRDIYSAICDLAKQEMPIDMLMVCVQMHKNGTANQDTLKYIGSLKTSVKSAKETRISALILESFYSTLK